MKVLVVVSSSLLVAGAIADATLNRPTLVKRDLTTITDAVNSVNSATASLYYTIKGPSDDIDLNALSDRTYTLLSTIQHGTSLVKKTSNISLYDAITLQGVIGTFSTTVNQTIKHLISSRSTIVDNFGPSVAQRLNDVKTACTSLSQAMVAKVPSSAQSRLSQMSVSITDSIQQGIAAFSATNGTGTSSASSTALSASSFSLSSTANSTTTSVSPSTAVATPTSSTTENEASSSAAAGPTASAAPNVVFALVAAAIMW